MKYTIQVNQAGADAAKLRGKVDIVDLAIFDAFKDFANGTKCEKKMTEDGRVWFWVSYSLIIAELPYCNITSNDGVYRRMKKLQAAGIIDFHPDNQRTNKTFFAWGATYDLLISDTDLRMKNRRGTDEKPDNHYTNNHTTKPEHKEEEKGASLSSSTSEPETFSLEAEKKENNLHRGAAGEPCPNCNGAGWYVGRNGRETCERCLGVGLNFPLQPPFTPTGEHIAPQPAKVVRLYENDLPGVTIIDSVPGTYTPNPAQLPPTEFKRVNIPEEIERLKKDYFAKETFAMVRKIPASLFPDYVEAFEKEINGTGETYHNLPAFRKHFFNWSVSRYEISQRKTTKQTGNNRSHITNAGGDLSKYLEKQKF